MRATGARSVIINVGLVGSWDGSSSFSLSLPILRPHRLVFIRDTPFHQIRTNALEHYLSIPPNMAVGKKPHTVCVARLLL